MTMLFHGLLPVHRVKAWGLSLISLIPAIPKEQITKLTAQAASSSSTQHVWFNFQEAGIE